MDGAKDKRTCRLCLKSCMRWHALFSHVSQETYIVEMIEFILAKQLDIREGWPQQICVKCCNTVIAFNTFKKSCFESEEKLRQHLEEPLDIKPVISDVRTDFKPERGHATCTQVEEKPDKPVTEKMEEELDDDVPLAEMKLKIKKAFKRKATKNYKCRHCSKDGFIGKTAFLEHFKIHMDSYKCGVCPEYFMEEEELHRHIAEFHKTTIRPFSCNLCLQKFSQTQHWLQHMRRKHKICRQCKKYVKRNHKCIDKNSSEVHAESNKPEQKVLWCTVCQVEFPSWTQFLAHEKTHVTVSDAEFACRVCPMTFSDKSLLICHEASNHQNEIRPRNNIGKFLTSKSFALCTECCTFFETLEKLYKHICMKNKPKKNADFRLRLEENSGHNSSSHLSQPLLFIENIKSEPIDDVAHDRDPLEMSTSERVLRDADKKIISLPSAAELAKLGLRQNSYL